MATLASYPHITFDVQGRAVIEGTRYQVQHLAAEHHYQGWSAEELLRQHPDLSPAAVYASLAYFYDHHDEMIAELERQGDDMKNGRPQNQPTRQELQSRRQSERS